MKWVAILISSATHLTAIMIALYFNVRPELRIEEKKADKFEIEAPLGAVFVEETVSEPPVAMPAPSDFPAEVTSVKSNSSLSLPGLPEGEAEPIGKIEPKYPLLSRKLGEEGEATFLLTIEASGRVLEAKLEKSSGSDRLDDSARAALLAARFQGPSTETPSTKRFRIEFRLRPESR